MGSNNMDPLTALNLVGTTIEVFTKLEPVVSKAITNFKPIAIALFEKYTGKEITPDQRQVLEDRIDEMHLNFQRPIPPETER